jgi:hypothetical protein
MKRKTSIRNRLETNGFAHYQSAVEYDEHDLDVIKAEFLELEPDEFAPEGVHRFRRYGNGIIIPWAERDEVFWIPPVVSKGECRAGYDQGSNNPDHQNIRYFNALSETCRSGRIIEKLVLDDFSHTFWEQAGHEFPIYFGVHFVKIQSYDTGDLGISSPNCFHQDGEPFTFAHLVHRSDYVVGGVNYIGRPSIRNQPLELVSPQDIVAEFTMKQFLESFAVFDPAVCHYVDPVRLAKGSNTVAERCIILIDFSQTRQNI